MLKQTPLPGSDLGRALLCIRPAKGGGIAGQGALPLASGAGVFVSGALSSSKATKRVKNRERRQGVL